MGAQGNSRYCISAPPTVSCEDKAWNRGRPRKWRRVKMGPKEKRKEVEEHLGALCCQLGPFRGTPRASEDPTTAAGQSYTRTHLRARVDGNLGPLEGFIGVKHVDRWLIFSTVRPKIKHIPQSTKCVHNITQTKPQTPCKYNKQGIHNVTVSFVKSRALHKPFHHPTASDWESQCGGEKSHQINQTVSTLCGPTPHCATIRLVHCKKRERLKEAHPRASWL